MEPSALFLSFFLYLSFSFASKDIGVRHTILSEGTDNLIKFHSHHGNGSVRPDTSLWISMTDVPSGVELARVDLLRGRSCLLNGRANDNRWKAHTLKRYGKKLVLQDIRPGMFFEFTHKKMLILGATTQAHQNAENLDMCFRHVGEITQKCFTFLQIKLRFTSESDARCQGIALILLQASELPQTSNLPTPDPDAVNTILSHFRPIKSKPLPNTVDPGVTKVRGSHTAFERLLNVVNQRILSLDDNSDTSGNPSSSAATA